MKQLFGLLLSLCISTNLVAQIDTEFWFAAPDLDITHAEKPICFCISSFDTPAIVVFEQPANSLYNPRTFSLNANSFFVYDVSDICNMVETSPYNTVLNYGFHIYSNAPISVYYESNNNNSEIYSLKGTNALGTNFIVPSQFTYSNAFNVNSRIEIVATLDETAITITPSISLKGGGVSNVPINITLNKGQTYAVEASGSLGMDHVRNTLITSNKPIAVNTSDDSVGWQNACADLVGDQIVPVSLLGTEYLALSNNTPCEYLYFFPTQDNTNIYLNDSQIPEVTLNIGQEYSCQFNSTAVYVRSDKPISVFQLTGDQNHDFQLPNGQDYELGGTVLPHINCTGSRKVVYKRNGMMNVTITLVVKSSCVNDFLLNGNPNNLTGSDFSEISSNSQYSYCIKDVGQYIPADGLLQVENTNENGYFQLGVFAKGSGSGTCSYGYFSNYNRYAHAEFNMNNSYCIGESVVFEFDSEGVDELTLIQPDGSTMTQQPFVLENIHNSQFGRYYLQAISCGEIQVMDSIDIITALDSTVIHGMTSIYPWTDMVAGLYHYFIDSVGINPAAVHWSVDRNDWHVYPHGASCELLCTSEGRGVLRAWTEGELCNVDTTLVLNATFYSVEENEIPSAFVYPNPTSGKVTIAWRDIVVINVFNLFGQKVNEYKCENQDSVELDMHNYQEGIYVMEITSARGKSYKQLILKR